MKNRRPVVRKTLLMAIVVLSSMDSQIGGKTWSSRCGLLERNNEFFRLPGVPLQALLQVSVVAASGFGASPCPVEGP